MITTCQICGETFTTYPSRLAKRKGRFCDRECYAKELSRRMAGPGHFMFGKRHRPDSIEKMRDGQTKAARRGEKSPTWKGGRHLSKGYVMVSLRLLPEGERRQYGGMAGRSKQRCIPEHRLIMARHLGRPLLPSEVIHHRNGVKDDNRLENLEMHDNSTHKKCHKEILAELRASRLENERLKSLLATCQQPG